MLVPLFLIWGSFLNVLAYRFVHNVPLWTPRSLCPHCLHTLAWYDMVPLLSWVILRGRCRWCHQTISALYPFVEMITALLLWSLSLTTSMPATFVYAFFFSALIISIRTDLETMLISRFVTLFIIPIGLGASQLGLIPLTFTESLLGAVFGYGILWLIASVFKLVTRKDGLGQGDMELLAFIGSFIGPLGVWWSLLFGSLTGALVGIVYLLITKSRIIPFGPFLALGAISFVLLGNHIVVLLR